MRAFIDVRLQAFHAIRLQTGIKKSPDRGLWKILVAPKGFEPSTSALRGRRPKPLDDGATWWFDMRRNRLRIVNVRGLRSQVAGVEGVEPSHTAPETAVLPLDDTPSCPLRALIEQRKEE